MKPKDGREVTEFHYFKTAEKGYYTVIAVVSGKVESYTTEGKFQKDARECDFDLCMAPIKREYWTNLFRNKEGRVAFGNNTAWESKEQAFHARDGITSNYIGGPIKVYEEEV